MNQDTSAALLIVNADDFGLSAGTNAGIVRSHERGIVTSASLMVRAPAAREAASYACRRRGLAVGLHVDLGEWRHEGGTWKPVYTVTDLTNAGQVRAEVEAQLAAFRELMGSNPTHLDSHQHVHLHEPVATVLDDLAGGLGVPLRHRMPTVRYCGEFYGQTGTGEPLPGGVSVEHLLEVIRDLPAGVTELGCHPGLGSDHQSGYARERELEVVALCHPRVKDMVRSAGVRLTSFAAVRP